MKRLVTVILVGVFVALVGWWAWESYQGRVLGNGYLLRANADKLKSTIVTPHLECPIEDGKNVLWCSTFQLAWNEGCALIGEDIHLEEEPPMVPILNKKTATKKDLDEASYVAMAGFVKDGINEKIKEALLGKFGEDVRTPLADTRVPGEDLVQYAFLMKDLRFAVPFEPLHHGELKFRGTPVRAFGLTEPTGRASQIASQVILHDEPEGGVNRECIVELKTKSEDDRLILAMVKPKPTLRKTIAAVRERMEKARARTAEAYTHVMVPKLNFDLLKEYRELLNKRLRVKNAEVNGWPIIMASQTIRFQLSEHGARLRSEAEVAESAPDPAPPIFNKPFLILLMRRDAKAPYFALWVDNIELLVPD